MHTSCEKDTKAIMEEQKLFIPIQDLPPDILERLPHSMFVQLFFGRPREEALTRTHWQTLTLELENVWQALEERAEGTTARLIEACLFYDFELKDIVYASAHRLAQEARESVDDQEGDFEQQLLQRWAISQASHAQAMQHPAAQELVRRGIRPFHWDEKP